MNGNLSKIKITAQELKQLRKDYSKGTRVELLKMDDPSAPLIGSKGTVEKVDDAGSIIVKWDNGNTLNVLYEIDKVKIIKMTDEIKEQILSIRDTELTNMFDSKIVYKIAKEKQFYELANFIEEYNTEYLNFILRGKQ